MARYQPGQPLDAVTAVARESDPDSELVELSFPSGVVLLIRWLPHSDYRPPGP